MKKLKILLNSILSCLLVGVCVIGAACDESSSSSSCEHQTIYNYDETNHWQICSVCGEKLSDETLHDFGDSIKEKDPAYDQTTGKYYEMWKQVCSVCGYTKETRGDEVVKEKTHTFSTEWTSNDSCHWHACTETGCNVKSNYENHSFGAWVIVSYMHEDGTPGERYRTCSFCGFKKTEKFYEYDSALRDNASSDAIDVKADIIRDDNDNGCILIDGSYKKLADEAMKNEELSDYEFSYCFAARINCWGLQRQDGLVPLSLYNEKKTEDFSDFKLGGRGIDTFSGKYSPSRYFGSQYGASADSWTIKYDSSLSQSSWGTATENVTEYELTPSYADSINSYEDYGLFRFFETDTGDFLLNPFSKRYGEDYSKWSCFNVSTNSNNLYEIKSSSLPTNVIEYFTVNIYFLALIKVKDSIVPFILAFGGDESYDKTIDNISKNCSELSYKGLIESAAGNTTTHRYDDEVLKITNMTLPENATISTVLKTGFPNTPETYYLACFQYITCDFDKTIKCVENTNTYRISTALNLENIIPGFYDKGITVVTGQYTDGIYQKDIKDALYWPYIKLHTLEATTSSKTDTVFYYPLTANTDLTYPYYYSYDLGAHTILTSDIEIVELSLSELNELGYEYNSVIPYNDLKTLGYITTSVTDSSTSYDKTLFRDDPYTLEDAKKDLTEITKKGYLCINLRDNSSNWIESTLLSEASKIINHFNTLNVELCGGGKRLIHGKILFLKQTLNILKFIQNP